MSKALEAVKKAVMGAAILDVKSERMNQCEIAVSPVLTNPGGVARAAISAYLAHLAEDEEVVRAAVESIGPCVNEADIRCMFRDIARIIAEKE